MEEKVDYILKILDEDGDSFARRAEMYYRRRPELLNFVEDFFKSYRALAERYDYISKELQSANRTIATIYPERVQLNMEDEEEEEDDENGTFPPENRKIISPNDLPAAPKLSIPDIASTNNNKKKKVMKTSRLMSKKGLLKLDGDGDDAKPTSGLTKDEALREIDKTQKQILALQTEKEFVKSSYENGVAKYWDIENQVTELQARVTCLQDEFGIGTVIEDDEARTLMASTALKSCQETLYRLQEQQEKIDEEAKIENQKVQNARLKFQSLVKTFEGYKPSTEEKSIQRPNLEKPKKSDSDNRQPEVTGARTPERIDIEALREKMKEEMQVGASAHLSMSGLAERVDELVDKIIHLETAVVDQNALVNRLREEADNLHAHLQRTEEEKESFIRGSETMGNKIKELEEELQKVQGLNQTITNQSDYIYKRITEASCRVDDLSGKLLNVLPEAEINNEPSCVKAASNNASSGETKHEVTALEGNSSVSEDQETNEKFEKEGTNESSATDHNASAVLGDESPKEEHMKEGVHQDLSTVVEQDELGAEDVEPNWRAMFLNGLDDRDKLLLEEYIMVLRNYKESKRKLNESEKKRRAAHFQYVVQMKILRNSITLKDAEIQALLIKLNSLNGEQAEAPRSSEMSTKPGFETKDENTKRQEVHRKTLSELLDISLPGVDPTREGAISHLKMSSIEEYEDLKMDSIDENHHFSTIEEKIHTDIDELLEENMEFWLRFSTSFHQIRKFQSSVKDLQDELQRKRVNIQKMDTKPLEQLSEIRPIYRHLKEIQTELTLWLEHSAVLKDDLQNKLSSLCNLKEEITRFSKEGPKSELSTYEAAKLQGEVLIMKRENKKVACELHTGAKRVERLQAEIRRTLQELDELGLKRENKSYQNRIPLRSFLFGVKLKKQKQRSSLFACVSPALQKQYSELTRPK
ncbi:unnamed protein product [Cuscuta campestris]|uniref:NAB domain-containing protein n=1 Tax=Cuscuta campestris TaxID=132261 RepID=A0A484NAS3_9ASTE|nr:unnamed protein product [Cuscuta campestris]